MQSKNHQWFKLQILAIVAINQCSWSAKELSLQAFATDSSGIPDTAMNGLMSRTDAICLECVFDNAQRASFMLAPQFYGSMKARDIESAMGLVM